MKKLIYLLFVIIMCSACTDAQIENYKNSDRGLEVWNYEFDGHLYVIARGMYTDSGVGITHSPNCSCHNNEE